MTDFEGAVDLPDFLGGSLSMHAGSSGHWDTFDRSKGNFLTLDFSFQLPGLSPPSSDGLL
jgi:hypothetical protein